MGETVKVYYTAAAGEEFSEEKSFMAPLSQKNDDLYIGIDRTVSMLRIDISESTGTVLELEGVCINPTNINVNFLWALLCFVFPMLICLVLLEMFFDKEDVKREFRSIKDYKYLLYDLVARDLKTKYRRSVLGILWSVLNPLLMMLVLTAIFSQIFRFEIDDFPVYYLTGYLIFNFVSEATNLSMVSIINAGGLIKKVYIPKFVFPLEKCLFSLVNMLFSLLAAVIVFVIVGVEPHATMLLFFVPILYTFLFNFGFSMILTAMNTFFRDVGYLYNVFITLWMYLTPIIYPISALPSWLASLIKFNPLYHYVKYFRDVTLYGTLPSLEDNLICISFSLIFLMIGFLVFRRKQNQFIFYI
jgi:ABC-2 type transport system permease protein